MEKETKKALLIALGSILDIYEVLESLRFGEEISSLINYRKKVILELHQKIREGEYL